MNREVHVRFWESPEVKVLRATRQKEPRSHRYRRFVSIFLRKSAERWACGAAVMNPAVVMVRFRSNITCNLILDLVAYCVFLRGSSAGLTKVILAGPTKLACTITSSFSVQV